MKVFYTSLLFMSLSNQGLASIHCHEEINQSGVHATITADFTESPTFLRDVTKVEIEGVGEPVLTEHLSNQQVCGVSMDFATACELKVRTSDFDYDATFSCQNKVNGEIISDGNHLSFFCQGPGVPMLYRQGLNFRGCSLR